MMSCNMIPCTCGNCFPCEICQRRGRHDKPAHDAYAAGQALGEKRISELERKNDTLRVALAEIRHLALMHKTDAVIAHVDELLRGDHIASGAHDAGAEGDK